MFAIAVNALYTSLRRRGTTRQLASAIVTCVISALLLLPAIFWYNLRFGAEQAALSLAEVEVALVYVALWGCILPLGVTTSYCLFTVERNSNTSVSLQTPSKRTTRGNAQSVGVKLPKRQPGVPAPFVYAADIPWGWLEHRAGRFQGQRLALNRSVMSMGREEDNDIWLDDETASRYHAELAWDAGQAYITDCDSMNGVLLNGRRIRGTLTIEPGDLLEVGAHRFLFQKAEPPPSTLLSEQDDPLLNHLRKPSITNAFNDVPQTSAGDLGSPEQVPSSAAPSDFLQVSLSQTKPLGQEDLEELAGYDFHRLSQQVPQSMLGETGVEGESEEIWQETAELDQVSFSSQFPALDNAFVICNGEMAGGSFLLDRPILTIGRGSESDVIIKDPSISRRHAQVLRQVNGDYVLDLASRNGTKVNEELLKAPHLLQPGDIVCLGNICLKYTSLQEAQTSPLPPLAVAPLSRPMSGPVPLRLPSKPNNHI